MSIFYKLFRRKNIFQFFNIACVWSVLMTPKSVKDIQRNKLQCLSTATHKNTQLVFSPLKTATYKKRPWTTKWDQLQEYTFGSSFRKISQFSLLYQHPSEEKPYDPIRWYKKAVDKFSIQFYRNAAILEWIVISVFL